jgi:hypothetical protein
MFPNGTLVRLVQTSEDCCQEFKDSIKLRTVYRVETIHGSLAKFHNADGSPTRTGFTYWTCDEPWTKHKWVPAAINSKEDMEALYG